MNIYIYRTVDKIASALIDKIASALKVNPQNLNSSLPLCFVDRFKFPTVYNIITNSNGIKIKLKN